MSDYYLAILQGSLLTVGVSLASLAVATLLGLLGAAAKLSGSRPLVWLAQLYTTVVRGVPELLMMLLIFYGGQIGLNWMLEAHGYPILRNGVSNYTRDKKSRIIFTGPIPDDTDDIKSSKDIPSWKRMCYCILKNDHNCRFMGFGLTRQQQRRIDIIRKKYKSVEAMENGV